MSEKVTQTSLLLSLLKTSPLLSSNANFQINASSSNLTPHLCYIKVWQVCFEFINVNAASEIKKQMETLFILNCNSYGIITFFKIHYHCAKISGHLPCV